MSIQGTYAVADLDLRKTYERLRNRKEVSSVSDISKGTFSFWIQINEEKVKVQVSSNSVNIWHKNGKYIEKTFRDLRKILLDSKGNEIEDFVLQKMQRIGASPISSNIATTVALPKTYEIADKDQISKCIEIINSTDNKNLLHSRLDQLRGFAWDKRTGTYEFVISCLERCFENPLVYDDVENYRLSNEICRAIISVENTIADSQSKTVISKIKNEISLNVIDLVKNKPELMKKSIYFLGDSARKEAVELFFNYIQKDPTKMLEGVVDSLLYDFSRALAKLYSDYGSEIDFYLDKMISSENEITAKAGIQLRRKMQENISSALKY